MADISPISSSMLPPNNKPWYAEMNRYHWWIFFVSSLGWLFDTMDQTLFRLARQPALKELLSEGTSADDIKFYSGIATAIFLFGWATGGLIFGVLGDRWGRARTMLITIVLYSAFTGLSALSTNWMDYSFYRFLTGIGVGGEFAAGVALISETLPASARPVALGLLQALSAVGNIMGACLSYILLPMKLAIPWAPAFVLQDGYFSGWRLVMVAGLMPAFLVIAVRRKLEEPESWKQAKAQAIKDGPGGVEMGSLKELFGDPRWRRNVIIGVLLAMSGVISVWGVSFWTPELLRDILTGLPEAQKARYVAFQDILQQIGSFFGILAFTWMATSFGRKGAFVMAFLMAWGMGTTVFLTMNSLEQMYWMIPLLGFCQMTVFGGYAIYFPELFPTRLRSTGTGFCYNVARFVAALGPFALGGLTSVFASEGFSEPFRYAAAAVLCINFVGLVTIFFAHETKGKELPT